MEEHDRLRTNEIQLESFLRRGLGHDWATQRQRQAFYMWWPVQAGYGFVLRLLGAYAAMMRCSRWIRWLRWLRWWDPVPAIFLSSTNGSNCKDSCRRSRRNFVDMLDMLLRNSENQTVYRPDDSFWNWGFYFTFYVQTIKLVSIRIFVVKLLLVDDAGKNSNVSMMHFFFRIIKQTLRIFYL